MMTEKGCKYSDKVQILNIHKPVDWSSFDVVRKVRNIIREKKVGHAGTLDPFAEGVLLLGIGKGTKKLHELIGLSKEYKAEIELGRETDTYDITGEVVKEIETEPYDKDVILDSLSRFSGTVDQVPPMFSAKKHKGIRLYKLARKGIEVERKPVKVTFFSIDLIDYIHPFININIKCSKGTYIRSLAHDLGEILGCGACLKSLCRTSIGEYRLEDSMKIGELERKVKSGIS